MGRDPLLDNAKFAAIVLVVVGHAWTQLRDVSWVEPAYTFVYLFHVPVFVLLAGHLSRRFRWTRRALYELAVALLIPYVLFETFYESLAAWAEGHAVHHNAVAPSWVMWFVVALFMWRISVPIWRRLGARLAIPLAIAVSLWGGMSSNDDYAWSKTLSLLPFFVIGMFVRREQLDVVRTVSAKVAALAVGTVTALACLLWASGFQIGLIRWKYSYAELGYDPLAGSSLRLVAIGAALVLAAAFFALVPGQRSWYSAWGANTMYSYLLHGVGIQVAIASGLFASAWVVSGGGAVVVTVAAAGIAVSLMAPQVRSLFRAVVEPGPVPRSRPEVPATPRDVVHLEAVRPIAVR